MTEDEELYARAGRIFDQVVDLDDQAREEALERARRTDAAAAVLARRLIQGDAHATPFGFDETPRELAEEDPAGVLGAAIGPYEVEALLGSGGMGAVYLGRRHAPEARVAIKFVTLSRASAAAIERFQSETHLLASIDHPGVVRYRDSGVDRRGRPYLVMDYVQGEAISYAVPEIANSVERTVAVMIPIAEAVHHLHQRRILHRDLKPSNILLRREGNALVPVLIDFGIARAMAAPGEANVTGTLGLGPVGTPAFMSPEQSRGDPHLDVRTDVHALGAVLYSLLTGHPPRDLERYSKDPVAALQRLRQAEAQAPSQRVDAERFGAERARRRSCQIDRDLDAIVLKALASRRDERYGSAEALAADLLRWNAKLPVAARMVGPFGRLTRTMRRRPLESALVVGSIVVLAATTVVTAISRAREVRARERYEEQLAVTEAVNEFFTEEVFTRALPEQDGPETPVIDVLRSAAQSVGEHLDERPAIAVAVRGSLLGIFARLGAAAEADEQLQQGARLVVSLPVNHPERIRFELQEATLLTRRNLYDEAETLLRSVMARLDQEPGLQPSLKALAMNALGVVLLSKNELEEAAVWLERSLATIAEDDQRRFEVSMNVAMLHWQQGDRDETVRVYEDTLADLIETFGEEHPYVVGVLANLASLHLDRRRPSEAMPRARRAVELAERVFEPTHPDRLLAQSLVASCLGFEGRFEETIALRLEISARLLERYGPDNPVVGEGLVNLANAFLRAGRTEEAAGPAWEGLATLQRTLGDANPSTASALLTVAAIEAAQNRIDDAITLANEAIAVYRVADGEHTVAIEEAIAWRDRLAR